MMCVKFPKSFLLVTLLASLLLLGATVFAQENRFPPAEIVNDEGGPVHITGEVTYTNPFFTSGVAQPVVILEDQAGFIDRNEYFLFPVESQTLAQITSDFYTSPFTYSLALPIEPQGTLRDVANDEQDDTGVMVFAVAYWNNTWGDPFLEERDLSGGGWSTAYASTRVSTDPEQMREIIGGKFLIYAPDDQQGFPSGFGEDGLLFTEDDPIVQLPQGYTVVDMDTDPFTFDRSRYQVIDLIEPSEIALVDYSDLSFTEAFDNMLEKLRAEYAFTEYKNIDWDALSDDYRPRFERADQKDDPGLYLRSLRDFLWSIPDGHVNLGPLSLFLDDLRPKIARGIGLAINETDDGRSVVTFLTENGPAATAGIELGAEILEFDGHAIADIIGQTQPWQTFSTEHNRCFEQQRFATRFSSTTDSVEVTYRNPGDTRATTATIPTAGEFDSFLATSSTRSTFTGFELPVEFRLLDNGYGYVAIYSFLDNSLLTIQLWERMIQQMRDANVPGLIVDMRLNGGGSGFLADQMTAYFFDEPVVVGQRGFYSEELGEFHFDSRGLQRLYLPPEELRYHGPVAVLVGPDCASACERFSYNLTLQDRAHIVGHFPTAGLGGSVDDFRMPLGVTVRFTKGRSVDADGNIHIEGIGVVPTLQVPLNEETLFSDGDPVLEHAVAALDGVTLIPTVDGGRIEVGETVTGEFVLGGRVRYTLEIEGQVPIDVFVGNDEGSITTIVRFYDTNGNLLLSNEEIQQSGGGNTLLRGLGSDDSFTVIVEIGTFEDSEAGAYALSVTRSG